MADLLRSPLHERNVALGAKLAAFGGWSMPIEYAGGGVMREHAAVREAVGIFDVSHLGKASVRGAGAAALVNATLTNDFDRIGTGQAQYTLCCDDATGGVVDDLIVYRYADDDVLLVPNAVNTAEVVARLAVAAPSQVAVRNRHHELAVLAVQGPRSRDLLAELDLPVGHDYMSFVTASWRGVPVVVCRSGYTGEHGYELLPPAQEAGTLWDALLALASSYDGLPCGLGARDTLRTEIGYPLHGHELSRSVTPVQARLGWAVGWSKPAFWGREVLRRERETGPARSLRGLLALDRNIARPGMAIASTTGAPLGQVTSGTFSPTLRRGIALALVAAQVADGDEVVVDVRGRPTPMRVVSPPFVPASPR